MRDYVWESGRGINCMIWMIHDTQEEIEFDKTLALIIHILRTVIRLKAGYWRKRRGWNEGIFAI
jgi:hypothetical protein